MAMIVSFARVRLGTNRAESVNFRYELIAGPADAGFHSGLRFHAETPRSVGWGLTAGPADAGLDAGLHLHGCSPSSLLDDAGQSVGSWMPALTCVLAFIAILLGGGVFCREHDRLNRCVGRRRLSLGFLLA